MYIYIYIYTLIKSESRSEPTPSAEPAPELPACGHSNPIVSRCSAGRALEIPELVLRLELALSSYLLK